MVLHPVKVVRLLAVRSVRGVVLGLLAAVLPIVRRVGLLSESLLEAPLRLLALLVLSAPQTDVGREFLDLLDHLLRNLFALEVNPELAVVAPDVLALVVRLNDAVAHGAVILLRGIRQIIGKQDDKRLGDAKI